MQQQIQQQHCHQKQQQQQQLAPSPALYLQPWQQPPLQDVKFHVPQVPAPPAPHTAPGPFTYLPGAVPMALPPRGVVPLLPHQVGAGAATGPIQGPSAARQAKLSGREAQRAKNREAANKSRARRKQGEEQTREELDKLRAQVLALSSELSGSAAEVLQLREQNCFLRSLLVGGQGAGAGAQAGHQAGQFEQQQHQPPPPPPPPPPQQQQQQQQQPGVQQQGAVAEAEGEGEGEGVEGSRKRARGGGFPKSGMSQHQMAILGLACCCAMLGDGFGDAVHGGGGGGGGRRILSLQDGSEAAAGAAAGGVGGGLFGMMLQGVLSSVLVNVLSLLCTAGLAVYAVQRLSAGKLKHALPLPLPLFEIRRAAGADAHGEAAEQAQ